ncbi:MAG: carboxylesterase family protein [Clostridiales bacterium]|nr:carboxylesterase family protein [Clostridiales bacterium]
MALTICKTENGLIEGLPREDADITEFRGIPYAKAPTGTLRFAPPVLPESWEGIRECKTWPKIAPQTFWDETSELYPYGKPECSEDCVYLNVYTPAASPEEGLPVFVWYHDGGVTNGWAYDPRNDPTEMIKSGIVVVTVGHRLGEFGYMSLPQFTKEQGQSGNYGVMDTILALEWVHRNIAAFGGSPDNVTIGGESGGTVKCCALAAIPRVKGLFHRVINQSGLAWLYKLDTQQEAEARGVTYLKECGIDPEVSLEELRRFSVSELHCDIDPHDLPNRMVKDHLIFDENFPSAFMKNIEGVDFLNCVCSADADPGCAAELLDENHRIGTREAFYKHFRTILGDLYEKYDFENLVQVTDETAWKMTVLLASLGLAPDRRSNYCRNIMVDRIFSSILAEKYPENRVYTLRFSQVLPPRTDIAVLPEVAAPHGSDLWYSYRTLERGIPVSRPWRGEDIQVARWLNEYLVNFIKTGDPNGGELPGWPRGGKHLDWLDLNIHPEAHTGLEGKLDELLYEYTVSQYPVYS